MKFSHRVTFLLLISLLTLVGAAQAKDSNAALRYLNAIGNMPPEAYEMSGRLSYITSLADLEKVSAKDLKVLDNRKTRMAEDLIKLGAACSECDYNPDRKWLPSDPVPPFRQMRTLAKLLVARGWQYVSIGDDNKAIDLWLAVFKFGQHAGEGRLLITGMIGYAISKHALKTLEAYFSTERNSAQKERAISFLKKLPNPVFDISQLLRYEKKYMQTTLGTKLFKPKDMVEAGMFEVKKKRKATDKISKLKACRANQRVLSGAIEMYLMDHDKISIETTSTDLLKALVTDKYLKAELECPSKGVYTVKLLPRGNFEVSCSKHKGLDDGQVISRKDKDKDELAAISEAEAQAKEYLNSDKFSTDYQETLSMMDQGIGFDPAQPDFSKKVKAFRNKLDNSTNILSKALIPHFGRAYELQVQFQQRIEALIKALSR